jgi:hypothetical protein
MAELHGSFYPLACTVMAEHLREKEEDIMELSSNLIRSRLAWCRIQRTRAITKEEEEEFLAEEEGLLDAMLGRDRTEIYSQKRDFIVTSYERGLHDGEALMRLQRWSDSRRSISGDGRKLATSFLENQQIG